MQTGWDNIGEQNDKNTSETVAVYVNNEPHVYLYVYVKGV